MTQTRCYRKRNTFWLSKCQGYLWKPDKMFTFLGNFKCIIFNSYSSIFFPATRRKSKLFQTGSRGSYYRSLVISPPRVGYEPCVQGEGRAISVSGGPRGMPRSPMLPGALTRRLPMHLGWGRGEDSDGCVCAIRLGTARGDGVPTSILHLARPRLRHLAPRCARSGDGISSAASLRAAVSIFAHIRQP